MKYGVPAIRMDRLVGRLRCRILNSQIISVIIDNENRNSEEREMMLVGLV